MSGEPLPGKISLERGLSLWDVPETIIGSLFFCCCAAAATIMDADAAVESAMAAVTATTDAIGSSS